MSQHRNYIDDLMLTNLFSEITPSEIEKLLDCTNASYVEYKKDEFIIEEGNRVNNFGIMLSGHGRSIKWDASGRVITLTLLKKCSEIGVIVAAASGCKSPISVQVTEDAIALLIPFDRAVTPCDKLCPSHIKLIRNYISVIAENGIILHERIDCLLKPTVREKILTYLKKKSAEHQSKQFSIPINRNSMAEYLNVERSALSRELSKMKKDGMIDYNRNNFIILG